MAKSGETPHDHRSEGGRIRPRPHKFAEPESVENRFDGLLRERISNHLRFQPEISVSDVVIDVRDGVVHLSGSVDTINTKYLVERLVKRVCENTQIENELKIRVGEALEEFTRGADAARLRDLHSRDLRER